MLHLQKYSLYLIQAVAIMQKLAQGNILIQYNL